MRKLLLAVPTAALGLALTGAAVPVAGAAVPNAAPATAWAVRATPALPDGAAGTLDGLSCPVANGCWAVGVQGGIASPTGHRDTLAEHWNGTTWTLGTTPNPSATSNYLVSVSCTSASSCEAVGNDNASASVTKPLAEHWNGTTWTVQATPLPGAAGGSAFLSGVSCSSSADCVTVGTYLAAKTGDPQPAAERWNGKTWTVLPAPKPVASYTSLVAVSCPTAARCLAVGSAEKSGGSYTFPAAESWNGTVWTVQTPATSAGSLGGSLAGVACPAATTCTAVGQQATSSTSYETLAERWNGTTWTVQLTGVTGFGPDLSGTSCPSATNCTAVGAGWKTRLGRTTTLAEHWNGTAWATQSTPSPGADQNDLNAVSCRTAGCVAVGSSMSSSGLTALAETN